MRWTADKEAELRELYPKMTAPQLAEHFGVKKNAIYQKANKMKLSKHQPTKKILTAEQVRWLKLNYPHMSTEIYATYLRVSFRTCVRLARYYGVEKTEQYMRESQLHALRKAKESHLRNGTYPPKGFIVPGSEKYRFKPGHVPHNPYRT